MSIPSRFAIYRGSTTPTENPPAGYSFVYLKTDGVLYEKNDSGIETALSVAPANSVTQEDLQERSWKEPVRVASTANIDLATGGLLTIDDVVLSEDDRVLVKDQSAPAENGLYSAKTDSWVRATDFDTAAKAEGGSTVVVQEGTANKDQTYRNTTDAPIVLGTTALVFTSSAALMNISQHNFMPDQVDLIGSGRTTRNGWRNASMAATGQNGVVMQLMLEDYTPGQAIALRCKFSVDSVASGGIRFNTSFFIIADGSANNVSPVTFSTTITPTITVAEQVIQFQQTFTAASLGSPAANRVMRIDFYRDGSHGDDTLGSTIRWLSGLVRWPG
jgi:phage-related tail fiber protein